MIPDLLLGAPLNQNLSMDVESIDFASGAASIITNKECELNIPIKCGEKGRNYLDNNQKVEKIYYLLAWNAVRSVAMRYLSATGGLPVRMRRSEGDDFEGKGSKRSKKRIVGALIALATLLAGIGGLALSYTQPKVYVDFDAPNKTNTTKSFCVKTDADDVKVELHANGIVGNLTLEKKDGKFCTDIRFVEGEYSIENLYIIKKTPFGETESKQPLNIAFSVFDKPSITAALFPTNVSPHSDISVKVNATDTSGIESVEISLIAPDGSIQTVNASYDAKSKLFEGNLALKGEGVHKLRVVARDTFKNSDVKEFEIKAFDSPVVTKVEEFVDGEKRLFTLRANVEDSSDVKAYATIRKDGKELKVSANCNNNVCSLNLKDWPEGSYEYELKVTDKFGNTGIYKGKFNISYPAVPVRPTQTQTVTITKTVTPTTTTPITQTTTTTQPQYCCTLPSMPPETENLTRVMLDVPYSKQICDTCCYCASLEMITAYWNKRAAKPKVTQVELLENFPEAKINGCANTFVDRYVESKGYRIYVAHSENITHVIELAEDALKLGYPVEITVRTGPETYHSLLIIGFDSEKREFYYYDPSPWEGPRVLVLKYKDFKSEYIGVFIPNNKCAPPEFYCLHPYP